MFAYIDAIVVDTPIVDAEIRGKIREVSNIEARLARGRLFSSYLDQQWQALSNKSNAFLWPEAHGSLSAGIERIERRIANRGKRKPV